MRRLLILECKKIATSVIYWLFVIAITFVFWLNYGNVDKEEINNASSASSLFYCAQDGKYAVEQNNLSEKNGQNQMMIGLTRKLLNCYKNNSYEYYPFGYIKVKAFSKSEQNIVLKYLKEITGMDKEKILSGTEKTTLKEPEDTENPEGLSGSDKTGDSKEILDSSESGISGEGQYIAKPGTGYMNEAGQYEFQPGEWEYVENPSDFSIQVSFQRFMEIMDEISSMIGKNSYFSSALIDLYYGDNDMENSPVTLKQHEEFYSKDKITGAFARYYCDNIALAVLILPAFVISAMMAGDRRNRVMDSIYAKPVSSFQLLFIRYFANVGMLFVPILFLPLKSFIILAKYANAAGDAIDIFAFPKYIIGWILPSLLFVVALSLFLSVLTRGSISVLVMGIFWIFFKPSVGKIAGGNYELFDIVIRHNTLKGFGRMMQHFDMLVINRIFIAGISFLFVLLSVWIYQVKRRGGLSFYVREFICYHKRKF